MLFLDTAIEEEEGLGEKRINSLVEMLEKEVSVGKSSGAV